MVKALLANSAWWLASSASAAAFALALENPADAQEKTLRRLLRENKDTAFGREHGFSEIRSHRQFCARVPIRDYDQFAPWIARIRAGEQRVLSAEPVKHLVPTGGSTAGRKLIPYTARMQRELNRAIGPWIFDMYRREPAALRGPSYWSVTPLADASADVSEPSAVPIGFDADSDYLGGWRRRLVDAAMAVTAEVRNIRSMEAWRYVTLLLLLRCRHLSLISVWHPSFLQLMLDAMAQNWEALVRDVAQGSCSVSTEIPCSGFRFTESHPSPDRAHELALAGPHRIAGIWPMLKLVSCWADGSAAPAAAQLARTFPAITIQPKGLLATEGVISIPFAGKHPLAIRSHFLEFEDVSGRIKLAAELQPGHTYGVILTTGGGLYRYRLHDLIRVDGYVGQTPSIRFVGRSGLISDRAGEKLTEGFVAAALAQIRSRCNLDNAFAMLAPDHDAEGCRYTLYLDTGATPEIAAMLDTLLSANPQYAWCRKLGQLGPPAIFLIEANPHAAYFDRLCNSGQRLGDIKPAALSTLDDWSNWFAGRYVGIVATDGHG